MIMIWFKGACAPFESIIDGNAPCSMNNSGIDNADFYKLVNWCWANKGIVSDKLFSEVYKLLYDKDMEFINEADYAKKESVLKEMIADLEIIVMLNWNN